jgi:hypothetical protein
MPGRRHRTSLAGFRRLAREWHPTKNGDLTPADIRPGSPKRHWWKCPEGADHVWRTSPYKRTYRGDGCPFCAGRKVSITNCLETRFPKLAREWHPSKNGEMTPRDVTAGSGRAVWWRCRQGHEWKTSVAHRTSNGSGCPACSGRVTTKARSLARTHPALAKHWHPTKNGALAPSEVSAGSAKEIWWRCRKGHEWQKAVYAQILLKTACPFCSGRRASATNSLEARVPEVAKEWHPTKNGSLSPADVTFASGRQVFWRCSKNPKHEWRTSVSHRTRNGSGCPYCAHQRTAPETSLKRTHPKLAKQWHPTKNGELTPMDVLSGSLLVVWWKCPKGPDHEWKAPVRSRTRLGTASRCPFCARYEVSVTNTLAKLHPEIARQWHPTKNGKLNPRKVVATSSKKVWWKCPNGPDHEWRAKVSVRSTRGHGCPFCSGHRVSMTNSLAELFPAVAEEWHPTKNGELGPSDVVAGSHRAVWWKCPKGPDHEWKTPPSRRTRAGTGCPCCAGQKVSVTNSLETLAPDIARQWHPTKNGDLSPRDLYAGSTRTVWWKCEKGPDHEWQAQPRNRVFARARCPYCAGRLASVTNNLAGLFPKIAREWHPKKNGSTPDQVLAGSKVIVWWRCVMGHAYRASVSDRTVKQRGCPKCGRF